MSDSTPPFSSTLDYYHPIEVFVVRPPKRRYWLHLLLLLVTLFSTLVIGAHLQYSFQHNAPEFSFLDTGGAQTWRDVASSVLGVDRVRWVLEQPSRMMLGAPFALTLMGILLAHEMGHYIYCVRSGVYATLPFFIPAPTLIGTLGAFIRIKSPIRSRQALFDIGIAGPIAGFVAASITLVFALAASKPLPAGALDSNIRIGYPLIFRLVHAALGALGLPVGRVPMGSVYLHPTAIAAWVGMFATALNLLPGGQLDGGHIVYALAPRLHRRISRLTMLLLLPLGLFCWAGWLIWAILLGFSGIRHPQVPPWPDLNPKRKLIAAFAMIMLLLTFIPAPFADAGLLGWPLR
jgi:hypothetical protein